MSINLGMLGLIFGINLVYITLNTLRFLLVMRGYRYFAAFTSVFEITVYVLGLSLVLNRLNNPLNLVFYALGYGVGVYVGMLIEDKMALGYTMISVILPDPQSTLPGILRTNGFGVTQHVAYGLEGERLELDILTPRKHERQLYDLIKKTAPNAFVIAYEPRYISGGFWLKRVKKRNARRHRSN
ncbi:DUF2179 domain-containing protein [Lactiplantibacillus mudanjiangensis]|uniref:UPF0316 protein MUDAN_MDHGFNIF_01127 n=1 Tax=Lactiplantibacillus mudanjiangensis TaxID=1296538 RepID=A0A660E5Z0_9LACO|nr:DUF2179 domain-containing protein [Lactiplantibacillus mudanjiangensis]VDG17630.1 hypothetical protein MUDAN_BIHEEGNE_00147 [Lactiplantibacillus mudanjiangensis]VDG23095.1 hypothetical protein MUDAN_IGPPGNFN_01750 [Lactiplantibacillus mudanjiangensis]VDG29567.1 hypothetical protein MUDAN_MDHGFNIF_01127 [Lactiplantibacillus mudanjiangensis]VDG32680.1 hypothetical protein MUDAN_DOGOELCO_01942 [Lactiplantibacillus mudanjiangensis]